MGIKDILLNNVSENKFFDISNFIEEIYLMEYDILILMARKFFNLFCVFHELNCQKYERLGIPYQNHGKIITNRALPLIKKRLKNEFCKVIVADDIIIHGRSIREVYGELAAVCPDLEILLVSYARDIHGVNACEDIMEKVHSRYLMKSHEWRELSDEITSIFYMSGRPYISYLPYFSLDAEWNSLKIKLWGKDFLSIQNEDMKEYGTEAYMYVGEQMGIFQKLPCCKICAIRFYYYSKVDHLIMVPYFCMSVMKEKALEELSDFFRTNYFEKSYLELLEGDAADDMRIMELEYVLSAWMSMYFLHSLKIKVKKWHREIEDYNFCERVLPEQMLSCREIEERLEKVMRMDKQSSRIEPVINGDIHILVDKFRGLKEKYKNNYYRWEKMKPWNENRVSYEQRFIDNYLAVNGELDEERCRNGSTEQKRLFGIPISTILDEMALFLRSLKETVEDEDAYLKVAFAAVLTAVDSGKGTIITKLVKQSSGDKYYESVIYAGEQNYKFYANSNFPIMYGLYLIEQEGRQWNAVKERKAMMIDNFAEYLEKERIFHIKEEMLSISKWDISDGYEKFLLNSYEKYYGNSVLDEAVTMAMEICNCTAK